MAEAIREWIDVKALAQRYSVGVNTIWRWSRDPDNAFPAPSKLGANCTRWHLDDLEKWEAERGAA
ncbi:AlpA family phage regulatory protein [Chromohalobacter sp. 296-RDG]|uniref:helix-turn-helix transcriptional regulator n=1 Tax=Chromohalobacter sp. 296-RDG TaxID=2994062 RepID=UPI002468E66A|nr:AlpA family phage regulatory protein [Chromohalobacter sp. 296-RDG]